MLIIEVVVILIESHKEILMVFIIRMDNLLQK